MRKITALTAVFLAISFTAAAAPGQRYANHQTPPADTGQTPKDTQKGPPKDTPIGPGGVGQALQRLPSQASNVARNVLQTISEIGSGEGLGQALQTLLQPSNQTRNTTTQ
ncbi:MAG: hypothetical protein ABEJ56_05805 [Candidatus Nanohaloarchaea archaeon]